MSQRKNGQDEEAGMVAAEQTGEELPERWSARTKTEIVLRLLKGEELGTISREIQVPVHELERWRQTGQLSALSAVDNGPWVLC
jgi:hypothetical protein